MEEFCKVIPEDDLVPMRFRPVGTFCIEKPYHLGMHMAIITGNHFNVVIQWDQEEGRTTRATEPDLGSVSTERG